MRHKITIDFNKVKQANEADLKRIFDVLEKGKPILLVEQNHGTFKSKQVYSNGILIDYSISEYST